MEPQEIFNNWVKLRVGMHFDQGLYQNEYEEGSIERAVYDAEWRRLRRRKVLSFIITPFRKLFRLKELDNE